MKTYLEVLSSLTIKNDRAMSQKYGTYKVMIEVVFRKAFKLVLMALLKIY